MFGASYALGAVLTLFLKVSSRTDTPAPDGEPSLYRQRATASRAGPRQGPLPADPWPTKLRRWNA
ncbi:hypothetical protein GCM10009863_62540 [Streptomyces axinellae]|uniref:Uncharacterized protein n=1 Tax=Streptomyces axinellae TaxID=552788 RepID=A0ABN3QX44_9ACTN